MKACPTPPAEAGAPIALPHCMSQPVTLRDVRLGTVRYLNVLPLLDGLDAQIPRSRWIATTPRELAARMQEGALDVAIMPTFEVLRAGGLEVVPDGAIACDGAVRSVQLFCKVPPRDVRRVLLDRSSLTSAHLVQVIAREHLRIAPRWRTSDAPLAADFDHASVPEDAILAIGDTALAWENAFPHRVDLGEAWRALEGLPFVFALWAIRPGVALDSEVIEALVAARDRGTARAAAIAAEAPLVPGMTRAGLVQYLTEAIRYRLGEREWLAIERYRDHLVAMGLLPEGTPLPRAASWVR